MRPPLTNCLVAFVPPRPFVYMKQGFWIRLHTHANERKESFLSICYYNKKGAKSTQFRFAFLQRIGYNEIN